MEIGTLTFFVPNVVNNELNKLKNDSSKKTKIDRTLELSKKLQTISINGTYADKEILEYVKLNPSIVGTMDKQFKKSIRQLGSKIISFHNDKLILE